MKHPWETPVQLPLTPAPLGKQPINSPQTVRWMLTLSTAEAALAVDEKVHTALHKLRVWSSFQIFNFPVHKCSEHSPYFLSLDTFPLLTELCPDASRPRLTQGCWKQLREQQTACSLM